MEIKNWKLKINSKGDITVLALVFGAIFVLTFSSIIGYITIQLKHSKQKVAWNQALNIAEAGLNYYRWHLAHAPDDLQDGQDWCCETPPCDVCGPYQHEYLDPEGGAIGEFSLEIGGAQQCGQTSAVVITSTGWTYSRPDTERTLQVKYARPTVADYAYLINDNVWAGSDREIKGPYHSNGGIRMDGENKALVSSARSDWVCTSSFGCDICPDDCWTEEDQCVCPGVFTTANGNQELFDYPAPPFDFDGITMDLAQIKSLTQSGQGIYLGPSEEQGYHIIFNHNEEDLFIDVYKITYLESVYAYNQEEGWHWEDSVIQSESFVGSYQVPNECGLIFAEDNLWVEGEIKGKVTLASADLINPNQETNIWLEGNIEYNDRDGSDGLVLAAQNNNLIGLNVPESMELHGIFIAQNGRFGRNHYPCSWYWPECKRDYLEIFGSVVSNGRVGTKWSSGTTWLSGFEQRENIYDPEQSFNPPIFLPAISDEHSFRNWEEVD